MTKKLTLTLDDNIIIDAKKYASNNNISLSRLVETYFISLASDLKNSSETIPPITKELSGMVKIKTEKSDKELLEDALNKHFL